MSSIEYEQCDGFMLRVSRNASSGYYGVSRAARPSTYMPNTPFHAAFDQKALRGWNAHHIGCRCGRVGYLGGAPTAVEAALLLAKHIKDTSTVAEGRYGSEEEAETADGESCAVAALQQFCPGTSRALTSMDPAAPRSWAKHAAELGSAFISASQGLAAGEASKLGAEAPSAQAAGMLAEVVAVSMVEPTTHAAPLVATEVPQSGVAHKATLVSTTSAAAGEVGAAASVPRAGAGAVTGVVAGAAAALAMQATVSVLVPAPSVTPGQLANALCPLPASAPAPLQRIHDVPSSHAAVTNQLSAAPALRFSAQPIALSAPPPHRPARCAAAADLDSTVTSSASPADLMHAPAEHGAVDLRQIQSRQMHAATASTAVAGAGAASAAASTAAAVYAAGQATPHCRGQL